MRRRWLSLLLVFLFLPLSGGALAVTVTLHESNSTTSGSAYYVSGIQNISQSFTAVGDYSLSRVSLYVYDVGIDDSLNVSLVTDAGGIPSSSPTAILSQGSNNTPSTANWYFFDLVPHVRLIAGTVYWIVARNGQPTNPNGYGWVRSAGNTYAAGTMAYDLGTGWNRLNEDMTFRNYGYSDANVTAALTANPTLASIGSGVRYTVYANNTGPEIASRVWLNLTFPSEVRYLSDDAASRGWTKLGNYSWTIANLAPGPHSYFVNATILAGVGKQVLTVGANADFRGVLGAVGAGSVASSAIIVKAPRVDLLVNPAPPYVRRSENVTFRVYYNNTGNDVARWLWINNTLPALGNYVTDDAPAVRSVGPGHLNLTFSNVTVGSHSFNVTFTQRANLSAGAAFLLDSTAQYRDGAGHAFPRVQGNGTAILRTPRVSVALSSARTYVTPGDAVTLRIDYANSGPGITLAQSFFLNLTLPARVILVNATSGYNASLASSGLLSWSVPTLLVDGSGVLYVNTTVAWPLADGTPVAFTTRTSFRDDVGIPMPDLYTNLTLGARLPVFIPSPSMGPGLVQAGSLLNYTLRFNNTGSGVASRVWVNSTLSPGLAFNGFDINMTSGLLVNFQPSSRQLHFVFVNVGPGAHSLLIQASPVGALANGTPLSITTSLAYRDANGNAAGVASPAPSAATIIAPALRGFLSLSRFVASPGDTVHFDIVVRNQGLVAAREYWVNLTLDAALTSLGDDAGVPRVQLGPRLSWHFQDLLPGDARSFSLDARVEPGFQDRFLQFIVATDYSDGQGNPLGQDSSPAVTLSLPAAVGRAPSLQELGLLATVIGAIAVMIAFVVLRSREPSIEEVLLIHREGLLLAQASQARPHGKDRDILAGSLVAIQAFIKDAFQAETEKDLERMDLGEYKILIRRGNYVFLVVALKGSPTHRTGARLQAALRRLEAEHADTLAAWMGNMDEMAAVQRTLEEVLRGHLGPHAVDPKDVYPGTRPPPGPPPAP